MNEDRKKDARCMHMKRHVSSHSGKKSDASSINAKQICLIMVSKKINRKSYHNTLSSSSHFFSLSLPLVLLAFHVLNIQLHFDNIIYFMNAERATAQRWRRDVDTKTRITLLRYIQIFIPISVGKCVLVVVCWTRATALWVRHLMQFVDKCRSWIQTSTTL